MADSFHTISEPSEGLFKDKGSKFLSFAIPIENNQEIKALLEKYRKEYYDARHVCYAYMIGAERNEYRSNDDGEPSGTAGKPILGQINSYNLTNILIIVVRYFGGILLGTSGLINAYKNAAKDAIDNAKIVTCAIKIQHTISVPYDIINDIMRIIKDNRAQIVQTEYDNNNQILTIQVEQALNDNFETKITKYEGYGLKRF
ncbi:MAG: YigZ family protein [Paludibacteraceae bacterium]|nr:YigZ family protein [Paludibacteraceae bacterium]